MRKNAAGSDCRTECCLRSHSPHKIYRQRGVELAAATAGQHRCTAAEPSPPRGRERTVEVAAGATHGAVDCKLHIVRRRRCVWVPQRCRPRPCTNEVRRVGKAHMVLQGNRTCIDAWQCGRASRTCAQCPSRALQPMQPNSAGHKEMGCAGANTVCPQAALRPRLCTECRRTRSGSGG